MHFPDGQGAQATADSALVVEKGIWLLLLTLLGVKPASQIQCVPASEMEFAGQDKQVVEAVPAEYAPMGQPKQIVEPVWPWNLPTGQGRQSPNPANHLYFPVAQSEHCSPLLPQVPALHLQWDDAELPAGESEDCGQSEQVSKDVEPKALEYLPATQSVQAAELVAVLYFPATQRMQVPPSGDPP